MKALFIFLGSGLKNVLTVVAFISPTPYRIPKHPTAYGSADFKSATAFIKKSPRVKPIIHFDRAARTQSGHFNIK